MSDEKRITIRVSPDLHERIRQYADDNRMSIQSASVVLFERALDGSDSATLAARIAALEAQVAALRS